MKGLVKGIAIGVGAIATAVGGLVTYKKIRGKNVEIEVEAEVKEPMKINPEYAETFLEEDEPTVEVEETE